MKTLVLGHKGMLGHMVLMYLKNKNISIETTDLRWPSKRFKEFIKKFDGEFIINCVGSIPQKKKLFDVNWELPIFLDFYSESKIIHPGSDLEINSSPYGVSKRISEDFIINTSVRTKLLKTSIIGPEKNNKSNLMEWFLSHRDGSTVYGYNQFYWNGNTTLTWSEKAYEMMKSWDSFESETTLSSKCITKKEILESLNEVFERKIVIKERDEIKINRCLRGDISTPHIRAQLERLKKFYYDRN